MVSTPADKKAQVIDRIVGSLRERLPGHTVAQAAGFARRYYAAAAPEDLLDQDPEDLYGAVLAHWNFTRQRPPGVPILRVYNPTYEAHGWQSSHTVVEVVADDMPFLVDSVTMELNRHGLTVHRLFHPVLRVVRDAQGVLQEIVPADAGREDAVAEATMHFEVDRQTDPGVLQALGQDLLRVLDDVRVAVQDWQAMRRRMQDIVDGIDPARLAVSRGEVEETRAFLQWVVDDHFTFLGYRDYDLLEKDAELVLHAVPDTGLGILRPDRPYELARSNQKIPRALRELACAPTLLLITKANARSTVHRPAQLDYLGVKRFDANGRVIGEHRFLGLYTSLAYSMNPRDIPLLRRKVRKVMERASLPKVSHAGKALQNILDTFPRDELFQATEEEVLETAMGIVHLHERQRLRLFVRKDAYGRFVSCMVYVPRDRYNTDLRIRMQKILMEAFQGQSSEFHTQFTEGVLARVIFTIRTVPGQIPEFSVAELEARLREAMQSWDDELHRVLMEQAGEARGNELFQRYAPALPGAYKDDYTPRTAVLDVLRLHRLGPDTPLAMHLYRPPEDPDGLLRFKVFGPDRPIPLSDVLPMLEKLGLRVLTARPYELDFADGTRRWVLDFDMKEDLGAAVDVAQVKDIFQDAFARVFYGQMENDGFNRLVLGARLAWRSVVMLRAYCKYLLQTRVPFSQPYMEQTLNNHPNVAGMLAELFDARFNPQYQGGHQGRAAALEAQIEEALEKVSVLDEDRILRRFLAIIKATLRTNFYQADDQGRPKEYLSFKFDPAAIPELPLPRPMFEISVYSPRVEAVHLRGGRVARGGLRWSDRREDFRTEVLGLVKAQMVKNAVIVPVGSKGGFVVKRPPPARDALMEEVVHCYKSFIRGMLDITDNRVDGGVQPPRDVVRYDEDDPYLVVAADKGTATFSDIANGIAQEYGFWLGDAFASGGSAGYDHKGMGITARGAWESVKRHFRELGKDIQNRDDFTVAGIGDMSGDVFGNGMLLSRHIRLVAAFNHLHIFIDPDPDPQASFEERQRLFQLPRSAWTDYNAELISAGGGVYPRALKSISLSPQARQVLGIEAERLTPNELVHHILMAPVDLLWNGGIGTYVKATAESHADAGDRANDAVRVNGRELRCKVVGEGGNLGFTQRGRIEYAMQGGKILTDAIDNSGGVNCSDHEVNIKILLDAIVADGDLTSKQRNQLLADMTEEVAQLVLRQNYLQPEAISITYSQAAELLSDHARVIRALERSGRLNRTIEFLPDDEELAEREADRRGLVPPELAVVLAYGKITLYEQLLASDVPEDPYFHNDLLNYFPRPMQERFAAEMNQHPLRREIISTYITNSTLNRMGSAFVFRLLEETGEPAPSIARAYSAARQIFDARSLWSAIDDLDNQVPAAAQTEMHIEVRRLLDRTSLWLLRNRRQPLAIDKTIQQFAAGIAALLDNLPMLLPGVEGEVLHQVSRNWMDAGVPEALARRVAGLDAAYSALDLIEVAGQATLPVESVAAIYFGLVNRLDLSWLRTSITGLPAANHWQRRARAALLDSLYAEQRVLAADVLQSTANESPPEQRLQTWLEHNRAGVERCRTMFADLRSTGQPDLAMLSVALREIRSLAHSEEAEAA
ncbi:MAG: NAD-glutamate dehydrogenase [Pseudomonadota bacterium]|nr:NAD-glutamate dehydrogenase [Pseudomonadota bacterium]